MSEAAKRYARALFELKQDRAGLAAYTRAIVDQPALYSALCNPTVSASDKVKLVETVLSSLAAGSPVPEVVPSTPETDSPNPAVVLSNLEAKSPDPGAVPSTPEAKSPDPRAVPSTPEAKSPDPGAVPSTLEAKSPNPGAVPSTLEAKSPDPGVVPSVPEMDSPNPAVVLSNPEAKSPNPGAVPSTLEAKSPREGATLSGKEAVLSGTDGVFLHFFKLLCQNARMPQLPEIAQEYDTLCLEQEGGVRARLIYAVKPSDAELERIKQAVCKKYHKTSVAMHLEEDQSLLGGFVLYVGNTRFDNSVKSRLASLQSSLQAR